jgi:dihydropteroate synthase
MATGLSWQLRDRIIEIGPAALVMGIVNVTPDSFSDGGAFLDPSRAIAHGLELVRQGAHLLDVGGESSRPGAEPVSADVELARILPVIEGLRAQTDVPLSIDTTKAIVADRGLSAGAHIINDITALEGDPAMAEVVRRHRAGVVLMHMQGRPRTMQAQPSYGDVVQEVHDYLQARLQATADLGIAGSQVVVDPGIGFGKSADHNLQLVARLDALARLDRPILLGVSRKRFLGHLLGRDVHERLAGSLAVACHAMSLPGALILRVHDVSATWDAVRVFEALNAKRLPCG